MLFRSTVEIAVSIWLFRTIRTMNNSYIEVNKRRRTIFLEDIELQAITDFLLWTKWYANSSKINPQHNIMARPQFIYPLNADKFDILLKKLLEKTPNLDYYLSGKHDFNIK